MPIDPKEVRHVADLSRIELSDEEVASLAVDLQRVVEHIDQLKEVDLVADADALTTFDADVHRQDRIGDSLDRDDALRNAPESDGTYFLVPKIVERDEE